MISTRSRIHALLASLPIAAAAHAQCTPQWDASLGYPTIDGQVRSSLVFDDGSGPALFVGGLFQSISGTVAHGIAKSHDGIHWQRVGGGFVDTPFDQIPNARINAMTAFDPDGAGPLRPLLVVAGFMDYANDGLTRVNHVAAWDGSTWSALGDGLPFFDPDIPFDESGTYDVFALEVFDDGSGPRLYAGGNFDFDGGPSDIAMFDGTAWVPPGLTGALSDDLRAVYDMTVHNDGSGPALYICGSFQGIIGTPNTHELARWDGTSWSSVGPLGVPPAPLELHGNVESFDPDGAGPMPAKLLCFENNSRRMDTWDGAAWTSQALPGPNLSGLPVPMVQYNNGTGNAIYFPSATINPDFTARFNLLRFNGSTFTSLGDNLLYQDGIVPFTSMTLNTLTPQPSLVLGAGMGTTTVPVTGGLMKFDLTTNNYAQFAPGANGPVRSYATANPGFDPFLFGGFVANAVAADLDGAGPQPAVVVVKGEFVAIGDVPADGLAVRSESAWSALSQAGIPAGNTVFDIHAVRSPAGTNQLYLTATTIHPHIIGGIGGGGVYRHDAGTWTVLGSASTFTNAGNTVGIVDRLVFADFGSGNELYAFGGFTFVDGAPAARFAKWNGTAWSPVVGGGIENAGPRSVVVHNDGSGEAIFAAGTLMKPAGSPEFVTGVLKWNGSAWSNVSASLPANLFANAPILVSANGQLIAIVQTDFGTGISQAIYRWNAGAWVLQGTTPIQPGVFSGTTFVGAANYAGSDRLFFAALDDTVHKWSTLLLDFDGTTWTTRTELGRVTMNLPTSLFNTGSGPSQSLWLFSNAGPFGVGAGSTPQSITTLTAQQGAQLARWFCPVPPCRADFNGMSGVTVQDIFDFLAAWFSNAPAADFNGMSGITVQDIFDFLAAWFTGC